MTLIERIAFTIIVCFFVFLAATQASKQCAPPLYRKGQVWEETQSSVLMTVSVALRDFAPSKLVCLARSFREHYPSRKNITIFIFSSREAAMRYMPSPPDYVPAKSRGQQKLESPTFWFSQLHAFYSYDAEKREEYLDIQPFGSGVGGPYDTRINLPTEQTPRCRLEISARCLVELDRISYPDTALNEEISGTVTLTGSLAHSGKIEGIHVAEVHVNPAGQKEMLVNEAVRNLNSWRFEPSSAKDSIRITYSYIIDPTLEIPAPYHRQVDVQLGLPNQVTIRGRSLE